MYQNLPSKPFLFTGLFYRGPVHLIINTWDHDVNVPLHLQGSEMAVLYLFPNDPSRSTDIHVDADKLRASVMVDEEMYPCVVPWRAVSAMFAPNDRVTLEWPVEVYGVIEEDGHVWSEDTLRDAAERFVDNEFHTPPPIQFGIIDGDNQSATEAPVQQEAAPALQLVT